MIAETASTRGTRPKLTATLRALRPGDTLVIYKPDRIARSMKELLVLLEDELHARDVSLEILAGICAGLHKPNGQTIAGKMLFMVAAMAAEMERELIHERTMDGLAAAAAQGRYGGRPAAVGDGTLAIARARQARGESVTSIAAHLKIGRSTLYRALQPHEADLAPAAAEPARQRLGHMPGASGQATLVSLGEAGRTEAHCRWLVLRAHVEDGAPLSRVAAQSGMPYRRPAPERDPGPGVAVRSGR